jgi:SIR2-like domain
MLSEVRQKALLELVKPADALLVRLLNPMESERFVFILGSALTAPAQPGGPGIPGVPGIVEMIRSRLTSRARSLLDGNLKRNPVGNAYQLAIEALRSDPSCGQEGVDHLFRDVVLGCINRRGKLTINPHDFDNARTFVGDPETVPEAWLLPPAVEALGEVIMVGGRQYGGDILTTNFDPLIGISIARAGGPYFRVSMSYDGFINGMWGTVPRIVHLHGFWFPPETLHTPDEISSLRKKLEASLFWILKGATVVVMGYGGWDDALMRFLRKASAGAGDTRIIWCFYRTSPEDVLRSASHVLEYLDLGIEDGRVELYGGVDLHQFMPQVSQALSDKEALLRGALSYYVSDVFDIDRETTRQYWAAMGNVMPSLKTQVEHEFKVNRKKLGQIRKAFDAAGIDRTQTDSAQEITKHLIQSRSGNWARIHVESPSLKALQKAKKEHQQNHPLPEG